MRTELTIVASADRSPRISASGGLSARSTGPDTVHMIGTAATPLGGDTLCIRIVVGARATLAVHSVAASLALPSARDRESFAEWAFEVEDGGSLVFDPEPMIVAADAVHHSRTSVAFAQSSSVRVRERVQIGRSDEGLGTWFGTLASNIDGRPHLRHRVELGRGTVGHDLLDAPMALSSALVYPDEREAATVERAEVRMPLAAGGTLTTSTGSSLHALPWQL